jgi:AraC-like DNA-binding protein
MSRSTLYRRFKQSGGISRYINDRRLAQCMSELRRAPATGDRVHEIASRWGFSDTGYFYRRFKAKFGMSPSECFEVIEPDPSKPGELSLPRAGRTQVPLLDWLRGDT